VKYILNIQYETISEHASIIREGNIQYLMNASPASVIIAESLGLILVPSDVTWLVYGVVPVLLHRYMPTYGK